MARQVQSWLLVLVPVFFVSACGGEKGTSPTSPTSIGVNVPGTTSTPTGPVAGQWQVVLIVSIAAEEFLNANILGADFLLDGAIEQRRTYSPAVWSSDFNTFKLLAPGRHTITARITNQLRTPTRYELTGFGQFARGVESISFECPRQRQVLATGGELACTFTLP